MVIAYYVFIGVLLVVAGFLLGRMSGLNTAEHDWQRRYNWRKKYEKAAEPVVDVVQKDAYDPHHTPDDDHDLLSDRALEQVTLYAEAAVLRMVLASALKTPRDPADRFAHLEVLTTFPDDDQNN